MPTYIITHISTYHNLFWNRPPNQLKAENSFIYDFTSVRLKRYLVFDLEWSESFCCES